MEWSLSSILSSCNSAQFISLLICLISQSFQLLAIRFQLSMKSFRYTAQNEEGEKIMGNIESHDFDDALEKIRQQGLQVIAIEEGKKEAEVIEELRPHMFEAILPEGVEDPEENKASSFTHQVPRGASALEAQRSAEEQHHTVQVELQEKDPQGIEEGSNIHEDSVSQQSQESHDVPKPQIDLEQFSPSQKAEKEKEESILFSRKENIERQSIESSGDELETLDQEIELILTEKKEAITEVNQERLHHLKGKIDLLRESPNKKRLNNLRREFKRVKKAVEKDIEKDQQKKWDEYEKRAPKEKIESYDEFENSANEPDSSTVLKKETKRSWVHIVDEPDEENEKEMLIKQQYESVWNEGQRFSSVLVAFYLLTFFISYYLKRSGIEDHFLVRIYDTTLFKQLILVLFTVFSLLTLRKDFLPKKLQSDVAVLLLGIILSFMIF